MPASSALPTAPKQRRLLDMAMLYASKTGAILVGVFILPQFNRLMGAEQFGVVAVIFSFQALLMVLDLGMATIVGRDIAAAEPHSPEAFRLWRSAETVIGAMYAVLVPIAFAAKALLGLPLSSLELLGTLLLFWSLTIQNIGQSALLARHHFVDAGGIQVTGVAARGGITLLALMYIDATLSVFVAAQLACALLQAAVTHIRCRQLLRPASDEPLPAAPQLPECLSVALRGRSLMLFGLAGAAVMQLDKVIVSTLVSPAAMTPYFLATLLCLTPLSVLAGPVAQFFQPRLIRAISINDHDTIRRTMAPFVTAVVLITAIPTAILWLVREPLVTAWLSVPDQVHDVAHYTSILLPGIAVGALGFIPYVTLIGRQDYRFQARLSAAMTVATLLAAAGMAQFGSIEGVCWVYAAYHAMSTLASWARCIHLERGGTVHHASSAAVRAAITASAVMIPMLAVALGLYYL